MNESVELKIELGHRAKIRDISTENGHTHDWTVHVKGLDGVSLEHFVAKVVFHLSNSYENPKRSVVHPPYKVKETGTAGFVMPIDIYFINVETPRRVTFSYNLYLHVASNPSVPRFRHIRWERLTFTNTSEDFREKLLLGGSSIAKAPGRYFSKEIPSVRASSKTEIIRLKRKKHRKDVENSSSFKERKKSAALSMKKEQHREDISNQPKFPKSEKVSSEVLHSTRRLSVAKRISSDYVGPKNKKRKYSLALCPSSLNKSSTSSGKGKLSPKFADKMDFTPGLSASEKINNKTQMNQFEEQTKADPSGALQPTKAKRLLRLIPVPNSDSPVSADSGFISSPQGKLKLKIRKRKISPNARKMFKEESQPSKHSAKRREKTKVSFNTSNHYTQLTKDPDIAKRRVEETSNRRFPVIFSSSSSTDVDDRGSSTERRSKYTAKHFHKGFRSENKGQERSKREKEISFNKERKPGGGISKENKIKAGETYSQGKSSNLSRDKNAHKRSIFQVSSTYDAVQYDLNSSSDEDGEMHHGERPFRYERVEDFGIVPPNEEENLRIEISGMKSRAPVDLMKLQRKILFEKDLNRLVRIIQIVNASQKLTVDGQYMKFVLCSLDTKTIREIKKVFDSV